jgi:hypothetical protein
MGGFGGVRDSLGLRRRFLSFGRDRDFDFDGIVFSFGEDGEWGRVVVVLCLREGESEKMWVA